MFIIVDSSEDRVAVGIESVSFIPISATEAGSNPPDPSKLGGGGAHYPLFPYTISLDTLERAGGGGVTSWVRCGRGALVNSVLSVLSPDGIGGQE